MRSAEKPFGASVSAAHSPPRGTCLDDCTKPALGLVEHTDFGRTETRAHPDADAHTLTHASPHTHTRTRALVHTKMNPQTRTRMHKHTHASPVTSPVDIPVVVL